MLHDHDRNVTRRQMLRRAACGFAVLALAKPQANAATATASAPASAPATATTQPRETIIDIHQHTTYRGRSNAALFHHQRKMGVTTTILLPGGLPVKTKSTLDGRATGLEAGAGGVETCMSIAKDRPGEYHFGANEVPDLPEAHARIEAALKQGALLIGEQKFNLPVESEPMQRVYALAQEYEVPVLMHFQYETYNTGYERLGTILARWPKVRFIAHAQTFWGHIDAKYPDQKVLYPKGKVTAGGLSDKYLSDFPNFFGDLSAGSGLNAFTRDEEHARGFIERHRDKLLYGSDCADHAGFGPTCTGSNMIAAIRRLSPTKAVERKLLHGNAKGLFRL